MTFHFRYNKDKSSGVVTRLVYWDDRMIGAIKSVNMPPRTGESARVFWIGDAHDWEGENEVTYDPINVGMSDDPDALLSEIEKRALAVLAPEEEEEKSPRQTIESMRANVQRGS